MEKDVEQQAAQRPAALVTGAGHRLGREFAMSLAGKGYDIALHYGSSKTQAETTAADIRALGVSCKLYQYDLAATNTLQAMVNEVAQDFPGLHLLLNSASAYAAAPIRDSDPDLFKSQFAVNFFAPLELIRQFAKAVSSGMAINIIDNKVAYHQYPYAAYLLSKKALAEATVMAAVEFAPSIRINGLSPGVVLPASVRSDDYVQWRIDGIPAQRQGKPSHLCQALHYIIDNDFVVGQILTVDGGEGINLEGRHSENYSAS